MFLMLILFLVPVFISNNITDEIIETKYFLPKHILDDCLRILEDRRIKYEEELAAEAEKCQGCLIQLNNCSNHC